MAATPGHLRTVHVHAATRACRAQGLGGREVRYAAHVGHGVLSLGVPNGTGHVAPIGQAVRDAVEAINGVPPRRALLVLDDALPRSTVDGVGDALRAASFDVEFVPLHADERAKSMRSVEALLAAAIGAKLERSDCFVAMGGGIVGDLTGFAASIYRRGVAWCNFPTTLLSMVDASIGGKTGCNLAAGGSLLKNMAGAFHDPALVVCDTATLTTLPVRELVAGLAECVKHAMIERSVADGQASALSLWMRLQSLADRLVAGPLEPGSLVDMIADNLELKARVVAADPFENASDAEGGRALLNLGHTFGHALETMAGLTPLAIAAPTTIDRSGPMAHGEAVALGLVAACVAGQHLGTCTEDLTREVERLLTRLQLPTRVDGLSDRVDEAVARLRHDKKARAGSVRIIVPAISPGEIAYISKNVGVSRVFGNPSDHVLHAAFAHIAG